MKHLGAALAVVVLMAGSTQAATAFDAINWPDELPWTATPEPATMILLGTGLLAAFRARRHQQA